MTKRSIAVGTGYRHSPRTQAAGDADSRIELINARLNVGMTQEAMSKATGLSQANYSRIEVGIQKDVTLRTARAITDALHREMESQGLSRSYRDLFGDLWLTERTKSRGEES